MAGSTVFDRRLWQIIDIDHRRAAWRRTLGTSAPTARRIYPARLDVRVTCRLTGRPELS